MGNFTRVKCPFFLVKQGKGLRDLNSQILGDLELSRWVSPSIENPCTNRTLDTHKKPHR